MILFVKQTNISLGADLVEDLENIRCNVLSEQVRKANVDFFGRFIDFWIIFEQF